MSYELVPRIPSERYPGKSEHIIKEGARYHTLMWIHDGTHCSEPDCEINEDRRLLMIEKEKNEHKKR